MSGWACKTEPSETSCEDGPRGGGYGCCSRGSGGGRRRVEPPQSAAHLHDVIINATEALSGSSLSRADDEESITSDKHQQPWEKPPSGTRSSHWQLTDNMLLLMHRMSQQQTPLLFYTSTDPRTVITALGSDCSLSVLAPPLMQSGSSRHRPASAMQPSCSSACSHRPQDGIRAGSQTESGSVSGARLRSKL